MHIHIDRKRHIELAWQRQVAAEERLAAELQQGPEGRVWEVRDLAHLEKIHQVAGSRVVVLCAFSRSCGCCKQALKFFEAMARQARFQHRDFHSIEHGRQVPTTMFCKTTHYTVQCHEG